MNFKVGDIFQYARKGIHIVAALSDTRIVVLKTSYPGYTEGEDWPGIKLKTFNGCDPNLYRKIGTLTPFCKALYGIE